MDAVRGSTTRNIHPAEQAPADRGAAEAGLFASSTALPRTGAADRPRQRPFPQMHAPNFAGCVQGYNHVARSGDKAMADGDLAELTYRNLQARRYVAHYGSQAAYEAAFLAAVPAALPFAAHPAMLVGVTGGAAAVAAGVHGTIAVNARTVQAETGREIRRLAGDEFGRKIDTLPVVGTTAGFRQAEQMLIDRDAECDTSSFSRYTR